MPSAAVVSLVGSAVFVSCWYFTPPGEYVGTAAVAGASLLFSATTYSTRWSRSTRENA